jgi:ubiquinone/menaquinone biosynthesis C-methylase UbiE
VVLGVSGDPQIERERRARRARSFANVADEYERGRPGYPPEAIAWLLGDRSLEVLDVGAGTGKLTGALLAAGHRVIAVEPLAQMRAILAHNHPDALVLEGAAEALPLTDASVDAVAVGAAFHWFDQPAALAQIRRVLRPPGVLGLLGNGFDTSRAWVAQVRELLGPPALGRPGHWPTGEQLEPYFTRVEEREIPHEQRLDRQGLRDLASSRSVLAIMPEGERQTVLDSLDRLWREQPELVGRTDASMAWRTRVRRCEGVR